MAAPVILRGPRHQKGFSIIELLLVAFIMAVGLMGLTLLQTMALRTAFGSQQMTAALKLADRVMDGVAAEGRQRRLMAQFGDTGLSTLPKLYIKGADVPLCYTAKGELQLEAGLPMETPNTQTYFRVTVAPQPVSLTSVPGLSGRTFKVTVKWSEVLDAKTKKAVERTVVLDRLVGYADN